MTEEAAQEKLADCRRHIDRIDLQLLALLNERSRIVEVISDVKQECSIPVYEPQREDEVFRNVVEHNHGPLSSDAVKRIFESVMEEMRSLQRARMTR